MHKYLMNQFAVTSDVPLPALEDSWSRQATRVHAHLHVRLAAGPMDGFAAVSWLGQRGERFLRSYDVGDAVVVCIGGEHPNALR